jgi:hypothetical protein
MRTLLDERFAPITSQIGFLETSVDEAQQALEDWRGELYDHVASAALDAFPDALRHLEPLTAAGRPREILVPVGRWTAYFDNSLRGTDALSAIGHLSRRMQCQGLAVTTVPHTLDGRGTGRAGAVQFELFGPLATEFLNYVRTVAVTFDGSRWVFTATGTPQAFEETGAYQARRTRDRFTSEMLERYCKALGIDVFDPEAYGPEAFLLESAVPLPADGLVMSLKQAQEALHIEPGIASTLPG